VLRNWPACSHARARLVRRLDQRGGRQRGLSIDLHRTGLIGGGIMLAW